MFYRETGQFLQNNKRVLKTALVLSIVGVFLLIPLAFVSAFGESVANAIIGKFLQLILQIFSALFGLIVAGFVALVQYNFEDFLGTGQAVDIVWRLLRDLSNMFFIIVLVVIAFGTMLRFESYRWQRMLPKLLAMAILINFSKTIALLILDAGQVLMMTFVRAFKDVAVENLTSGLRIDQIYRLGDHGGWSGLGSAWATLALMGVMMVIATFVMAIIAIMLVARMAMIWIMIAISPVAYVTAILNSTKKHASSWWNFYIKVVLIGPSLAFFLWFVFLFISFGLLPQESLERDITQTGFTQKEYLLSAALTPGNIVNFLLGIILLVVGTGFAVKTADLSGGLAGGFQRMGVDYFKRKRLEGKMPWFLKPITAPFTLPAKLAGAGLRKAGVALQDREGAGWVGKTTGGVLKTVGEGPGGVMRAGLRGVEKGAQWLEKRGIAPQAMKRVSHTTDLLKEYTMLKNLLPLTVAEVRKGWQRSKERGFYRLLQPHSGRLEAFREAAVEGRYDTRNLKREKKATLEQDYQDIVEAGFDNDTDSLMRNYINAKDDHERLLYLMALLRNNDHNDLILTEGTPWRETVWKEVMRKMNEANKETDHNYYNVYSEKFRDRDGNLQDRNGKTLITGNKAWNKVRQRKSGEWDAFDKDDQLVEAGVSQSKLDSIHFAEGRVDPAHFEEMVNQSLYKGHPEQYSEEFRRISTDLIQEWVETATQRQGNSSITGSFTKMQPDGSYQFAQSYKYYKTQVEDYRDENGKRIVNLSVDSDVINKIPEAQRAEIEERVRKGELRDFSTLSQKEKDEIISEVKESKDAVSHYKGYQGAGKNVEYYLTRTKAWQPDALHPSSVTAEEYDPISKGVVHGAMGLNQLLWHKHVGSRASDRFWRSVESRVLEAAIGDEEKKQVPLKSRRSYVNFLQKIPSLLRPYFEDLVETRMAESDVERIARGVGEGERYRIFPIDMQKQARTESVHPDFQGVDSLQDLKDRNLDYSALYQVAKKKLESEGKLQDAARVSQIFQEIRSDAQKKDLGVFDDTEYHLNELELEERKRGGNLYSDMDVQKQARTELAHDIETRRLANTDQLNYERLPEQSVIKRAVDERMVQEKRTYKNTDEKKAHQSEVLQTIVREAYQESPDIYADEEYSRNKQAIEKRAEDREIANKTVHLYQLNEAAKKGEKEAEIGINLKDVQRQMQSGDLDIDVPQSLSQKIAQAVEEGFQEVEFTGEEIKALIPLLQEFKRQEFQTLQQKGRFDPKENIGAVVEKARIAEKVGAMEKIRLVDTAQTRNQTAARELVNAAAQGRQDVTLSVSDEMLERIGMSGAEGLNMTQELLAAFMEEFTNQNKEFIEKFLAQRNMTMEEFQMWARDARDGLKNVKVVNRDRLGGDARHVVAHENMHDMVDTNIPWFRQIWYRLGQSNEGQQVVTNITNKVQSQWNGTLENDTDVMREFFTEALTNMTRWGRKDSDGNPIGMSLEKDLLNAKDEAGNDVLSAKDKKSMVDLIQSLTVQHADYVKDLKEKGLKKPSETAPITNLAKKLSKNNDVTTTEENISQK